LGCERDDFCIDAVTPKLILRFYDADSPTTVQAVGELSIWPEGIQDTLVNNASLDSIALPLDVNSPETVYNFRMGTTIDQITITYNVNEVFVSRSCGFKALFSSVLAFPSTNWIRSIETISTTIEDESAAHIHILH